MQISTHVCTYVYACACICTCMYTHACVQMRTCDINLYLTSLREIKYKLAIIQTMEGDPVKTYSWPHEEE